MSTSLYTTVYAHLTLSVPPGLLVSLTAGARLKYFKRVNQRVNFFNHKYLLPAVAILIGIQSKFKLDFSSWH